MINKIKARLTEMIGKTIDETPMLTYNDGFQIGLNHAYREIEAFIEIEEILIGKEENPPTLLSDEHIDLLQVLYDELNLDYECHLTDVYDPFMVRARRFISRNLISDKEIFCLCNVPWPSYLSTEKS